MATEPTPQRLYRAACPNCGAPVDFRSAASAFAVCSFCKSTLVRDGETLRRTGQAADLFDDHTPLQLGAAGTYQGERFSLVGRLQYRSAEGTWNEWHALFESGDGTLKSGWLSEDNGRYVFAFDAPIGGAVPSAAGLRVGTEVGVAGERWSVASITTATLHAPQGELPYSVLSSTERPASSVVADLRSRRGEVGTLDYSDPAAPRWSIGRSVALAELAMQGLAETAEGATKTLQGRSLSCPNCGAALVPTLETTQVIVCPQCRSVVDLSATDTGAGLAFYAQQNGTEPQIALGSVGLLALGGTEALPWQVVGYVERCELPDNEDDERIFWCEYLLYHRTIGFAFLVDAQDGWSWTAPIIGVPEAAGEAVKLDGWLYRKLYDYTGIVTYVLGEFYWRVEREQRTFNSDYQGTGSRGDKRLNREMTGSEVVWSAGGAMAADVVAAAFRLPAGAVVALQRDALPTAFNGSSLLAKLCLWGFIAIVVLLLFRCSGSDDCRSYGAGSNEYRNCLNANSGGGFRSIGGGYGGYSGGGSHK